jgi:hypothetical protein
MTSGDMLARLQTLPCDRWSELATRPRSWPDLNDPAPWTAVPGASFTIDEANELARAGLVFKCLRYCKDELAVVVLLRREPPRPKVKTSGSQSTLTEWNDHRAARLRKLWLEVDDDGPAYTTVQIAEILGVPPESVRTKVQRMELPARGPSNRRERLAA